MNALGKHILVEYFNCDYTHLNQVTYIEESMLKAARSAGATIINSTFHHFSPYGVSGVVVIQESHLAIHTWPEYGYAAVDIFTCGESIDPWKAYQVLLKASGAEYGSSIEIARGNQGLFHKRCNPAAGQKSPAPPAMFRNIWFTQRAENIAVSLRHRGDVLYRKTSPFQEIVIYDTYAYGRMLTLGGNIVLTEKDEYNYHEMLTHVPLCTHPAPAKVLVIGGGDGGTIREVLKHPEVAQIRLVEIDEEVIKASCCFFPGSKEAFEDARVEVTIGDGGVFIKEDNNELYDIILIDALDPISPDTALFSIEFYRALYRKLTDQGIVISPCHSPYFNKHLLQSMFRWQKMVFGEDRVFCYLVTIPAYPSGMWCFSFSTRGNFDPSGNLKRAEQFAEKETLHYYSPEVQRAAFTLPPYIKQLF